MDDVRSHAGQLLGGRFARILARAAVGRRYTEESEERAESSETVAITYHYVVGTFTLDEQIDHFICGMADSYPNGGRMTSRRNVIGQDGPRSRPRLQFAWRLPAERL